MPTIRKSKVKHKFETDTLKFIKMKQNLKQQHKQIRQINLFFQIKFNLN